MNRVERLRIDNQRTVTFVISGETSVIKAFRGDKHTEFFSVCCKCGKSCGRARIGLEAGLKIQWSCNMLLRVRIPSAALINLKTNKGVDK